MFERETSVPHVIVIKKARSLFKEPAALIKRKIAAVKVL
jgi:hypothetical protein